MNHLSVLFTAVISLLLGFAWYFMPHLIIIVGLCLAPLALLFVLHYTFLIILLFIIFFSFFRIHEVIPVIYSLKISLMLSMGALLSFIPAFIGESKITIYWSNELTLLSVFFLLVILGVILPVITDCHQLF